MKLSERGREVVVASIAGALFLAGGAMDLAGGRDVDGASAPTPEETPFTERALFCPPTLQAGTAMLAMASPLHEAVSIGIEPEVGERTELPPDQMRLDEIEDRRPLNVVGFGSELAASYTTDISGRFRGTGSVRCSRTASERWHFAEGSSARGFDQRLLIYNPFPDEAVVRITFHTDAGEISRAQLANLAVASGDSIRIRVNDFILRRRHLATTIAAQRGRVVTWRLMLDEGEERPAGTHMSLGAAAPSDVWYFPDGGVGTGYDERLALVNPTDEEAVVTVTLVTSDGAVQVPDLAEIVVPARAAARVRLPEGLPESDDERMGVGAIVQSTNGVPVVAERTIYYSIRDLEGVAAEVGATEAAERWVVGPAATDPSSDSIAIMNPAGEEAQVTVTLLRVDRDPLGPDELRRVTVPAGGRIKLPLAAFTEGSPMVALVVSDRPVVAERFAYSEGSSDASALMGTPLTASP